MGRRRELMRKLNQKPKTGKTAKSLVKTRRKNKASLGEPANACWTLGWAGPPHLASWPPTAFPSNAVSPASPLLSLESGLETGCTSQRDPGRDATLAASGLAHGTARGTGSSAPDLITFFLFPSRIPDPRLIDDRESHAAPHLRTLVLARPLTAGEPAPSQPANSPLPLSRFLTVGTIDNWDAPTRSAQPPKLQASWSPSTLEKTPQLSTICSVSSLARRSPTRLLAPVSPTNVPVSPGTRPCCPAPSSASSPRRYHHRPHRSERMSATQSSGDSAGPPPDYVFDPRGLPVTALQIHNARTYAGVIIPLLIISSFMVLARIVSRKRSEAGLAMDDHFIVAAAVRLLPGPLSGPKQATCQLQ